MIEAVLQEIGEFFLQVVCYYTAWLLVPVFSFGLAYVEPVRPFGPPVNRHPWHGCYRDADNRWVVGDQAAILIGLLFWVLVAILVALIVWA